MNEICCPYCGAQLQSRSLTCPSCGNTLPRETLLSYGKEARNELDNAMGEIEQEFQRQQSSYNAGFYGDKQDTAVYGSADSLPRCPHCQAWLTARTKLCPHCGKELSAASVKAGNARADSFRPLDEAMQDTVIAPAQEEEKIIDIPRTIEELKLYARQKGMPLIKMRFFVGVDYQQPRAFGIYRDKDTFIVYKNKDNGQRAIRYQGPDEAFAVNELYQKLLDECHLRGIYPDGQPKEAKSSSPSYERQEQIRKQKSGKLITAGIIIAVIAVVIGLLVYSRSVHGYYRIDDRLFYRDGTTWYIYYADGWDRYDGTLYDYDDYYLGYSYSSDYGAYDVEDSSVWQDNHTSDSSDWGSNDYSDWDSGGTDWSSDW